MQTEENRDFDSTQIDRKKYATGGAPEIETEEQPIDMLDHLQIARATKGTIFQSSIKFKENIELEQAFVSKMEGRIKKSTVNIL